MRFLLAICACFPTLVCADDLLPADHPMPAVIDHYVTRALQADKIAPAPAADDAEFIRRAMLDLVGRIPSVAETDAYVTTQSASKKDALLDGLIASPAFAKHQANQFETLFAGGKKGDSGLREYLHTAMSEKRPWSQMFREMVNPDESNPAQKGASTFIKGRMSDLDKLTNDASVAFFGVNVSCAQCHDHPLVADWKQDHFYGMKSFFARSYLTGDKLGERDAGVVKFKPAKGDERTAKMMFLTGKVIDLPNQRELTKDEQRKDKETTPTNPSNSARAKLVETALAGEEATYLAKAIVNRLWHRMLGHGLVMPLDQMHSENPASHPELLDWLARDTATHNYDLRRLFRGIAGSQAYARASRYPSSSVPQPKHFAVAKLKPMTPMQLATSLKIATADQAAWKASEVEAVESTAKSLASRFTPTSDDQQIGVSEALLFSNSDAVLKEIAGDAFLTKLLASKAPSKAIETLIRQTLGRPATEDEIAVLTAYLAARSDRPAEAYRQVLWALVTGPEFRFNH